MRATAMYLIDKLALRAGNEKGDDEADTVGCCSLRYEHVTLQPPNELVFDFLGKDSIRYYNVVAVDQQVFKNIRIFKGDGKAEGDAIFDRVTVCSIFLTGYSGSSPISLDVILEQTSSILYERSYCKSVPYLQRLDHFPRAT
jgi:DNA topoisomerase-1